MAFKDILHNLPEVRGPTEKKLAFNIKLKWTIIVLVAFFVLANIPLLGIASNALQKFEYLAILLGTDFGSIISLGIGPIVMASIILQLLVGSKILEIDTSTDEGKKYLISESAQEFEFKTCDLDFGEITGIQMQEQFKVATANYTIIRKPTPFGINISQASENRTANFESVQ